MSKYFSAAKLVARAIARFTRGRGWVNALAAIGFLAVFLAPLDAAAQSVKGGGEYYFTNQAGDIHVPRAAAGTVLARDYLTPQTLCGAAQCSVASFWQCSAGQSSTCTTSGPSCTPSVNTGLCTQVVINGQVSAGFAWSGTPVTINQPVEVRVVSTGTTITTANMGLFNTSQYLFADASLKATKPTASTGFALNIWNSVVVLSGTCTVPDQTITLPSVKASQFSGVGSTAGAQSFNLQLNNCPAGFGRLGYSLIPVGGANCPTTYVPNPCAITSTSDNGVLPLSAGSTATGVAIQVTNASGSPLPFRYSITARAVTFTLAPAASYTIPMVARYIQTGNTITPGSVSSQMQVLLDYE